MLRRRHRNEDEDVLLNFNDSFIQVKLEMAVSLFYHDIYKEKTSLTFPELSMNMPARCAALLKRYIHKIVRRARGVSGTNNWELHPHSKFYSQEGTFDKVVFLKKSRVDESNSNKYVLAAPSKEAIHQTPQGSMTVCPYHIVSQLGVKSKSGSVIECTTDRCRNKHVNIDNLDRNDVAKSIRTIGVRRIRELSMAELGNHYNK